MSSSLRRAANVRNWRKADVRIAHFRECRLGASSWHYSYSNQALDRVLEVLSKEGSVRDFLDVHGLRHARGMELAHGGASEFQIMAQLEHATERAAKEYRRQAARRTLADGAQDRIDNVVRLRTQKRSGTS